MSINKIFILGNLGRDPETRQTQSGSNVVSFSVATTERYKAKNGEMVDDTQWHNVSVFGSTADACAKYLHKGSQVFIEGQIKYRTYQDSQGTDRTATDIIALRVEFIGGKSDNNQQAQQQYRPAPQAQQTKVQSKDDDLPF